MQTSRNETLIRPMRTRTRTLAPSPRALQGGFSAAALASALSSGKGFRIVVQPQVHLETGRIVGAEALIRWRHTEYGDISPSEFLPVLSRLGLEQTLFEFVMDRVQDLLCTLRLFNIECPISVNASADVLSDAGALHRLEKHLQQAGLPPRLLKIEVTEDKPAQDLQALAAALSKMRARGFGISMDDFGVGCSSLKRLVSLPFSELKIDRMFVQEMMNNAASHAVVLASLELGAKLGLRVVAEGVETDEQARLLQEMGCWSAQGYGLSRPLEITEFISKLLRNLKRASTQYD